MVKQEIGRIVLGRTDPLCLFININGNKIRETLNHASRHICNSFLCVVFMPDRAKSDHTVYISCIDN